MLTVPGHVDAGKSTLMGRLLLELKFVEQHLIDRYRRQADKMGKSSFALAWVMDQREEERERGVTIDIATNQFETEKTRFTILDAPGHQDFVPNMIAGASQADFAVLVIDANTGAFEKGLKGQTREHALLLRSLGVQRVIVAVNKLDMVGWSQERFNEISEQVTGFMKGNGFLLKNVTFVPISGLNGDNLVIKSDAPGLAWYTGETLIEALENSEPLTRALEKPFRMSIAEIYRSQQSQMTVYGRIESGTVQTGEDLIVQPSGESASIRSIEVDSEPQEWAVAGQNVSLALYGIDAIHVRVGDIISSKANPIETSDKLTMKVLAFDHLMPMPVDVHRGRLHAAGRIEAIPAVLNKTTGALEKKNPKIVQPGKVARVVVRLESKVPLEVGQRVVLRSGGQTVAAGLLE
jgi:elongation factor 1 alpha-like protein